MTPTAAVVDDSYSKVESEEEIIEEDTAQIDRSEKESLEKISERTDESAVSSGLPSSLLFPPKEGDPDQYVKDVSNSKMAGRKFRIFLDSSSQQPLVVPETWLPTLACWITGTGCGQPENNDTSVIYTLV